ncbi:MAG: FHA domain-containing protein [Kofleriaceae bacterium]
MFKLVIQDDEGKTTVVPLIRDEITIGRKEGNTIRLTERNVSRRHARIMRNNGEVHIEDLGSYNGIRVNNARIAERVSLRVSDQVQIGDYKLYLKAEGVEQVDDARTMPIERVDANGEATTQPNGQTPTVPLGVPTPAAAAANGLANPQLVGQPNRTMVAIADTDPAGRPVATAAAVAALTAPVGYGRLVVLSSNFAGKEFELSRPQMIIGRTDENDIVINHRSISRNHAKLVREPETGRYTISDLQSSNGVRVNGQDYSKVELRRGDVVDLGHVRLRFIEPGEDFVFSRDAVITDVPESGGSKKGLLVAIVLAFVVLGGVGVFMLTRGGGDDSSTTKKNPDIVTPGSGTGADNNGTGSDNIVVDNNPPVEVDAGIAVAPTNPNTNPSVNNEEIILKCNKLRADRKWPELVACGDELSASDPAKGKEFHDAGINENKAESLVRRLGDAAKKGDLEEAKKIAKGVPETSVYRRESEGLVDNARAVWGEQLHKRARAVIDRCKDYNKIIAQARGEGLDEAWMNVSCKDTTVAVKTNNNDNGNGSNTKTTPPPKDPPDKPEACDADALKKKGDDYLGNGMDTAALAQFEASLRCKYDSGVVKTAFLAACRSKQAAKAKLYYAKLPPNMASNYSQICLRFGITVP